MFGTMDTDTENERLRAENASLRRTLAAVAALAHTAAQPPPRPDDQR